MRNFNQLQKPLLLFLTFMIWAACSSDDNAGNTAIENESIPMDPILTISDLNANVSENHAVGVTIAQFEIVQQNLSEELTAELLDVTPVGALVVDNEGRLLVADATAFDFERREAIIGQVQFTSGALAQTVSFRLVLTDMDEAPVPFISRWRLEETLLTINLPLYEGSEDDETEYNFIVDWGDGSEEGLVTAFDDADASHTYASSGVKTVTITGKLKGFNFSQSFDSSSFRLVDISQWGDVELGNGIAHFGNCTNLLGFTALDTPILKSVTDLRGMFAGAISFNQNLANWDVSKVTNMASMFFNARAFNQDLSTWNVSNVTNMGSMFDTARAFDQDLSKWDVSQVQSMVFMFNNADAFNQDVSNWDVSNVFNMTAMFQNANTFNQDISTWNVSQVLEMGSMFRGADTFNQNLSSWDTGNVTNCSSFNLNSALQTENLPVLGPCFGGS